MQIKVKKKQIKECRDLLEFVLYSGTILPHGFLTEFPSWALLCMFSICFSSVCMLYIYICVLHMAMYTHTHIYMYIYVCICECMIVLK